MEKRIIIFVVISLFVIIIWDYFVMPKKDVQQPVQTNTTSVANNSRAGINNSTTKETANITSNSFPSSTTLTPVELSTSVIQGQFIKEQGFFKNLFLKHYTFNKQRKDFVDIFRTGFIDVFDVITINDQQYKVIYSNMNMFDKGKTLDISLLGEVDNIQINKVVSLDKEAYAGTISYKFISKKEGVFKLSTALVLSQHFKGINASEEGNPAPHFFAAKRFESPSERQLKKGYKLTDVTYGGTAEKYFAFFIIDPKASLSTESILKEEHIDIHIFLPSFSLENNKEVSYELKFFAGPKDPEILRKIGYHLDAAVDYGFFHFIARPLLIIMNFFYRFSHNYGISIILLTILIKLAFFPLSHKSYKSMKALQSLQPRMEEIRKKYANDKEALNREMMLLYKRHGVNPLSGCLPMIVQIPFFIALYQALMSAIELRQAPFIFWITDLSSKDPYYVTPILMGITMLLQQMLTPSSGDPTQKKMMYILPVVFTFMFLNFPSGLVLYWLVNNIFSILQQLYTMKSQKA